MSTHIMSARPHSAARQMLQDCRLRPELSGPDAAFFSGADRLVFAGNRQYHDAALSVCPAFESLCGLKASACTMEEIRCGTVRLSSKTVVLVLGPSGQEMPSVPSDVRLFHLPLSIREEQLLPDYFSAVYGLLVLALRTAAALGAESGAVDTCRACMDAYADAAALSCGAIQPQLVQAAQLLDGARDFETVGLGPELGTAGFFNRLLISATHHFSNCENAEEWCHLNFFLRKHHDTAVLLFASGVNPGMNRIVEAVTVMRRMERPLVVCTDAPAEIFPMGTQVLHHPSAPEHWMAPLGQILTAGALVHELRQKEV